MNAGFLCKYKLLPGREVTLLGPRLVAAVVAVKINAAEGSVVLEVGRRVRERVLAAKLFFNIFEAV